MLRPLLAAALTLAALSALAPPSSAVYICGHQEDASDLVLGDEPVEKAHCTTENLVHYDCDAYLTVYQDGTVYRATRCDPIICTPYCDPPMGPSSAQAPCVGTADADTATLTVTCSTAPTLGYDCDETVWADPLGVHRTYVECDPLMYCVTEPCPGGGPIRV